MGDDERSFGHLVRCCLLSGRQQARGCWLFPTELHLHLAGCGHTWVSNNAPSLQWVSVASSADGNRLVAANNAPQTIYVSTNAGAVWTEATNAPTSIWRSVASSADGIKLIAVNSYPGSIYASPDGGLSWMQLTNAPGAAWTSVASSADGTRSLATSSAGVYASSDSGLTWTSNSLPAGDWEACAASADGSRLIVASRSGFVYTSVDSGASWTSNSVPLLSWNGVATSADGSRLFAAASSGGVWRLESMPAPELNAAISAGSFRLAWVLPSMDFVLQHSADCLPVRWEDVTNAATLNPSTLRYEVALPLSDRGFYRLKSQ